MLKKPELQQEELEWVSIAALVAQHLLRKVDRTVDFSFIRDRVKHLYSEDNGRPHWTLWCCSSCCCWVSLRGASERQLMREVEVNVAYAGSLVEAARQGSGCLDVEPEPRRRFAESTIYQEIFDEIVLLAVNKGLASGAVLYTDSTHLKANANKNKYDLAEVAVKPQEYLAALEAAIARIARRTVRRH